MSHRAPFFAIRIAYQRHLNIQMYIESEIRLFADDCVCYREIKEMEYIEKLQNDIDRLGVLARI